MIFNLPSFTKTFPGPIIIIGLGSIGKGLLPLLQRHLVYDEKQLNIISPKDENKSLAIDYGANFIQLAITEDNYQLVLKEIINSSSERAFIINLANEVSSSDLIKFAFDNNCHYIDTVVEPWKGFYFNDNVPKVEQTNYKLRESLSTLRINNFGKEAPTAISCCGANPGMVSWLVKQALLNMANDLGLGVVRPASRNEWASLMMDLNIKGIHIAEKDTQISNLKRELGVFTNTWSPEGCLAECLQPAELGWGTHEENLPTDGHEHDSGSKSAIYLDTPGGSIKVQTWTPTTGSHFGYLITHNEAISISDFFTLKKDGEVVYRPTCHYAYHPSKVAIESIEEFINSEHHEGQTKIKILTEDEIISGADELGVLLYGNEIGAYWYGSRLTIEQTRLLAPHQNATGLQVTSAVLTGIIYAINHPNESLIEADDMDFDECLEIQRGYLGDVAGYYTDWKPKLKVIKNVETNNEKRDPWQFSNIRISSELDKM